MRWGWKIAWSASTPPASIRRRRCKQKPNVGYMRQLSAEGVLGLNPELILATEGSGPKETLAVLGEAKVPIVTVPESFSEDGIHGAHPHRRARARRRSSAAPA